MILHCVYCNFLRGGDPSEQEQVFRDLAAFSATLDGVLSFEFGPNRDFEGKSPEYAAGFVIKFVDKAALQTYAAHETHKQLGAKLCALCVGGADGIIVFDLDVS